MFGTFGLQFRILHVYYSIGFACGVCFSLVCLAIVRYPRTPATMSATTCSQRLVSLKALRRTKSGV